MYRRRIDYGTGLRPDLHPELGGNGSHDPTYGSQIGALSIPGYIAPTDLCVSKPFSEKRSRNFLAENSTPEKVVSNKSL